MSSSPEVPATAEAASPARRLVGTWILLAALGVALLLDLGVAIRGNRPLVSASSMTEALRLIEAERKPGDLVVFSPLFSMTELVPLGKLAARPDLPAPELRASRRVLVLDLADHPMFGFGRAAEVRPIGEDLRLAIYPPKGDQPVTLFDLATDLERAELRIERPRGTVTSRCTAPRVEGGRSCPGEADWLYLAPRDLTIEGKNTSCIWAHPTTGGDLVIRLPAPPDPPAGRRLELRVAGALTDDAVRLTSDGASVRTDVEQNGAVRGGVTVENRVGWFRAAVEVVGQHPIELRISTERDGRRHHCLNAQLVEVP